jgi:hypothetical protein
MGFLDKLLDLSGQAAASHAEKAERTLDRVERDYGSRMNSEQQNKVAQGREDVQKMREYAEHRRDVAKIRDESSE